MLDSTPKNCVNGIDLDALGEQMAARKAELMRMAKSEGLPPATTTAVETA